MLTQERLTAPNCSSAGEIDTSGKSPVKLKIGVIFNSPTAAANSAEYVSESGVLESVSAFAAALRETGHDVQEMAVGSSASALAQALAASHFDVVVNFCESFAGQSASEPHVAALFELLQIPYTGSGPEGLALTHDKPLTKRLLIGGSVSTPEFVEFLSEVPLPESQLRSLLSAGALIVKPAAEDASLGVDASSVCSDWESLIRQIDFVRRRYGAVLVERFIAGREFNVGIIELPELQVLPLAEIEFQSPGEPSQRIVTYDGKWSPDSVECVATPVRCPAVVDSELADRIRSAATAAYRLTGCRDYARIDLRVDSAGNVFVLEVNANPDAGPTAGLARMLTVAGISYSNFAERIVEQAQSRCDKNAVHRVNISPRTNINSTETGIRSLNSGERGWLLEMTTACRFFRTDEIEIADELLREAERDGDAGHYKVLVVESDGSPVAWSCHGRVPLTDATFDLYWIVVAPDAQNRGVGRRLLAFVEEQVREAGGRWLLAETSSTKEYEPTRRFYETCGYRIVGEVEDFYRHADGRITFGKRLDGNRAAP
jgi:D-alanine-D-alanine ligase